MTENAGGQDQYVPLPTQDQVQQRFGGGSAAPAPSQSTSQAWAPREGSTTDADPGANETPPGVFSQPHTPAGSTPGPRSAWDHTPPAFVPGQAAPAAKPSSRRGLRFWLIAGVAMLGFGFAGLNLAQYIGASFGVVTALLMVVSACVPLGIVIPTFLWLDRFEAEPTKLLVLAFAWGAVVAAFVALYFNSSALLILSDSSAQGTAQATAAVVVAPIVEEACKGLLVLLIWRIMRHEFDGLTDGMVYAGIVAAGFAFTENILYLGDAYGSGHFTATFVLRCLLSPFAHPMFTICTGIGIGIAATTNRTVLRVMAPVVGYLVAVFAHGLWNLSAVAGGGSILAVYLVIDVPIFCAFIGLVVWARRHEGRLIGQFLSPYARAGWLAPAEVAMLSSMPRRREARMWARANSGRRGLAAMRAFQDSASELALLRRRMYHTTVDDKTLAQERALLDTLVSRRRAFVGQPMS